jgi:hypothetical protein
MCRPPEAVQTFKNPVNERSLHRREAEHRQCRQNNGHDGPGDDDVAECNQGDQNRQVPPCDQSRTTAAHFGLGLPLVKSLAEALWLTVNAVLNDGLLTITVSGLKPADRDRKACVQVKSAAAAE